MMRTLETIFLKKGAERRVRGGHLWVYSNEVDVQKSPIKALPAGEQVLVKTASGQTVGVAQVSPHNLICARLVSRSEQCLDADLMAQRIRHAQALRDRLFTEPCYRLVHGESDLLPGLVVDRFGDYFSVQLNTAGMDRLDHELLAALEKIYAPKGILFKNDSSAREQEGLSRHVHVASGVVPERVELTENQTRFVTALHSGQKTGWFYDHRYNRRYLQTLVNDCDVLDVFSYVGGWGVQALVAGARSVTCVDSSAFALALCRENAQLNQQANALTVIEAQAIAALKQLAAEGKTFDVIVLDPPAFIKKSKDKKKGEEAYHHHNQLALKLLKPGGILVSASCSMHLQREQLLNIVRVAATQAQRDAQVFYQGGQAGDHPVHPAIAETEYLKAHFVRVS